jgi:hypothetical protein
MGDLAVFDEVLMLAEDGKEPHVVGAQFRPGLAACRNRRPARPVFLRVSAVQATSAASSCRR